MAPIKNTPVEKEEEMIQVPSSLIESIQKQMLELEKKTVEQDGIIAGLKEMNDNKGDGEVKLREKKSYEPKFRTARLRKYPVAGNFDDQDYIVGWSNRGAYQIVDRTGVSPMNVDVMDVIFLRDPKKAEQVKLLDILNKGTQEHVKIIEIKKRNVVVQTGEEIDVTNWDPAHGLTTTGEKIDGMTTFDDTDYVLQIPGHKDLVTINQKFLNL